MCMACDDCDKQSITASLSRPMPPFQCMPTTRNCRGPRTRADSKAMGRLSRRKPARQSSESREVRQAIGRRREPQLGHVQPMQPSPQTTSPFAPSSTDPALRRARARGCSGAGPIGARDLFVDTRREEVHDDQCDQVTVEIRWEDLPLRPRRNPCRCAARVSTASGNARWRTNSENSLCSQRVKKDWPRGWMVIHSVPAASSSKLRQNSLFDAEHGRRKRNAVFQG